MLVLYCIGASTSSEKKPRGQGGFRIRKDFDKQTNIKEFFRVSSTDSNSSEKARQKWKELGLSDNDDEDDVKVEEESPKPAAPFFYSDTYSAHKMSPSPTSSSSPELSNIEKEPNCDENNDDFVNESNGVSLNVSDNEEIKDEETEIAQEVQKFEEELKQQLPFQTFGK